MVHKLVFSWRGALLGVLAGGVSFAVLGALPAEAGAASAVNCPATISAPGTYVLESTCNGGELPFGILITSSNVTLKLNGQTITAFIGIEVDDSSAAISGVTIKGPGEIHAGGFGVDFGEGDGHGVSGSSVSAVTFTDGSDADGIILKAGANDNTISGNTTNGGRNGFGIGVAGGSGNTVNNNIVNGGSTDDIGIEVETGGTGNTISGNTVDHNHVDGILGGSGNTISNNTVSYSTNGGIFGDASDTVNGNTANNNGANGIAVDAFNATGGTVNGNIANNNGNDGIIVGTDVTVNGNTANNNGFDGIRVDGTGNTINNNTALSNSGNDLVDANPGCDSNTWRSNTFGTSLDGSGLSPSPCIH